MKRIVLFIFLLSGINAHSTIHYVTSLGDSGAGSVRDLIGAAASGDTIEFSVAGTITLVTGEISINQDLTILSSGAANLTLSGNSSNRIFDILAGKVHINSISFENGTTSNSGGAIQNASSDTVTIEKCVFNSCVAAFDGGAIVNDGAFLNIYQTSFTNNLANFDGGAIRINTGTVRIEGSCFNGNTSNFSGAGIRIVGGTCDLINSTLSGNTALLNGGGFEGTMNLINCTITGNTAQNGGGAKPESSTFRNCIVYGNTSTGVGPNFDGAIISHGNNLVGDTAGSDGFASSDLKGLDPLLDILGLNGGYTATHALLGSSPCVDAGTCVNTPSIDQRDVTRTGIPDIGAYEFGGIAFVVNQVSEMLCDGDTIIFGSQLLDSTGVYSETFTNITGCDSTVEITVSLVPVYFTAFANSICSGDTMVFGSQTLTTSGIYTESYSTVYFCDSILELNLTVISPDVNVVQSGTMLTAPATSTAYQWIDCNTNQAIPGETSQIFTATVNGQYAVIVTENGCTDTSACMAVSTVDISKLTSRPVQVYPTSTSGKIAVVFQDVEKTIIVRILNLLGEVVFENAFSNQDNIQVDLAKFDSGSYIIQIDDSRQVTSQRVFKY
ncbi:MAG: T9SS type A sorting domain-containing protein [Bacteroidia bacterium]|nr:T9SS type A sorting domain-containing protein [Bacteroidia bacterium]